MRTTSPRLAPLQESEWTPEQAELMEPLVARGRAHNIFKTLVRHPTAMKAFFSWANFILSKKNTLPPREREIVILRIGYLCRSGYEWAQHERIGKRAGLSDEEIARLKLGAAAPGWSPADEALVRAADELHQDQFISDATWNALTNHFEERQCMDVVYTAAQYMQVSMILNTFGVQLDPDLTLDPELKGY